MTVAKATVLNVFSVPEVMIACGRFLSNISSCYRCRIPVDIIDTRVIFDTDTCSDILNADGLTPSFTYMLYRRDPQTESFNVAREVEGQVFKCIFYVFGEYM